jgi:NAD+ kinase
MDASRIARLGLVVHPRRDVSGALDSLRSWSDERGVHVVQVPAVGQSQRVAEAGDPGQCDAIVALGGDGTALAALRTAAAVGKPVLGVACGSLGALTTVAADGLARALGRLASGDWEPRLLPALVVGDETMTGVNDLVVLRQGAGQISVELSVDGELFVRYGGDGLVLATALGSSAYTLAAGGPVLAPGGGGMVFTPVSPHGGCCPPLVAGADSRLTIELDPGHGGARIELDGQIHDRIEPHTARTLEVALRPDHATLVSLGDEEPTLARLRRRRVIMDSPRMLSRERQEAARAAAPS